MIVVSWTNFLPCKLCQNKLAGDIAGSVNEMVSALMLSVLFQHKRRISGSVGLIASWTIFIVCDIDIV